MILLKYCFVLILSIIILSWQSWCFDSEIDDLVAHRTLAGRTTFKFVCDERDSNRTRRISGDYYVYGEMYRHNLPTPYPQYYDYHGIPHTSKYICVTSAEKYACIFNISAVVINKLGAMIDNSTQIPYDFAHESMTFLEPIHYHSVHQIFLSYFQESAQKIPLSKGDKLVSYDLVIPLRMIWDDIFNHISHQAVPHISHIYEFIQKDIVNQAVFHCSYYTAAVLLLLDIPLERLLIQTHHFGQKAPSLIFAKRVIFPWLPGWVPTQTASVHGVAKNVTYLITTNLFKRFGDQKALDIYQAIQQRSSDKSLSFKRTILYLSRAAGQTRHVSNEFEIIIALNSSINHDLYDFKVVGQIEGSHKELNQLHHTWYTQAVDFSRASLIIGSHGSAFVNLIWSPEDVNYIEFNVQPHDPLFSSYKSKVHERPAILNSAWAKGGTGRYFIIDPCMKSFEHFYIHDVTVSVFELLSAITSMGKGYLAPNYNISQHQQLDHIDSDPKHDRL